MKISNNPQKVAPVLLVCCLLLAAIAPSSAVAASTDLTASADTYTRTGVGAGTAQVLDVRGFGGGDFMAYLRFDLSSLPAGATIDAATLNLHYEPGSRSDTITAGRFANFGLLNVSGNTPQNWDEATLADATTLNVGQEYGSGAFADLTTAVGNGWLSNLDQDSGANVTETIGGTVAGDLESLTGPDLVTFLNGRLADGGQATIISAINASGRGYGFASSENADSTLVPTLSLTYTAPVPEPSTFALLGLGVAGLLARRRISRG